MTNELGRMATDASYQPFPALSRHTTVATILSHHYQHEGAATSATTSCVPRSSFIQSVFNAVNVLVGIGILALPLAFRCGGWIFGTLVFLFCAISTNYTAKLIARCLDACPSGASTYGDMGAAAFNEGVRAFVSGVFVVELLTIG